MSSTRQAASLLERIRPAQAAPLVHRCQQAASPSSHLRACIAACRRELHQLHSVPRRLGQTADQVLPLLWAGGWLGRRAGSRRFAGSTAAAACSSLASCTVGSRARPKHAHQRLHRLPQCRYQEGSTSPALARLHSSVTRTPSGPTCASICCSSWLFRSMAYAQARSACTSGMCRCLHNNTGA